MEFPEPISCDFMAQYHILFVFIMQYSQYIYQNNNNNNNISRTTAEKVQPTALDEYEWLN